MRRLIGLLICVALFTPFSISAQADVSDSYYRFSSVGASVPMNGNDSFFAGPDTIYTISKSVVSRFSEGKFQVISKVPQLFETNQVRVVYGNGKFIGTNGNELFLSQDAIVWNKSFSLPVDLRANPLGEIFFQNGKFLIVGGTTTNSGILTIPLYVSTDGEKWEVGEFKSPLIKKDEVNWFNLFGYSNGTYILAGNKFSARSDDLKSWITIGIGQWATNEYGIQKVAMAIIDNVIVITTVSIPSYWRSDDLGKSWQEITAPNLSYLPNIVVSNGHFILTSSNYQRDASYSYSSTDALSGNWKSTKMPISSEYWSNLYVVKSGESIFVLTNDSGSGRKLLEGKPKSETEMALERKLIADAKAKAEVDAKIVAENQLEAKKAQEEAKAASELKAKQEAEAKAAAELKAKQEAEAKAAAELKAKQEAEAAAELKAKQDAAADKAALAKAQSELAAANAALADAQKVNREQAARITSFEEQFKVLSESVATVQNQVSQLNTKLSTALKSLNTANAKIKKICAAKPKPKGC